MEANDAFAAIRQAIGEDSGGDLTLLQGMELMAILWSEGSPESAEDCASLVMGEENETGASVPERLIVKHPKLHEWLDALLT